MRSSGEDKRRGYKPLLPSLGQDLAKFGQKLQKQTGKWQRPGQKLARSLEGKEGKKDGRGMERSWAGVGQELGTSGPVPSTPSWASPGWRTAPRIPPGLSMGTAVWDGSLLHFIRISIFLTFFYSILKLGHPLGDHFGIVLGLGGPFGDHFGVISDLEVPRVVILASF